MFIYYTKDALSSWKGLQRQGLQPDWMGEAD